MNKHNCLEYLWDLVKNYIDFINIILISSVIEPFSIRFTRFIFNINLNFALSAVFYFDTYLDDETDIKNSGKDPSLSYFIYNQVVKTLWAVLITYLVIFITNLIIMDKKSNLHEFYREALVNKVDAM